MRYLLLLVLTICLWGCWGDRGSPENKIWGVVHDLSKDTLRPYVDSLRSAAPPCTVIVHDTVRVIYGGVSETLYVDTLNNSIFTTCLYATEAEVCKVRGHDLTDRVGWSDFPNPFYDETYFECKWCGAIIRRIINSPAPDTAYKEKSPPTK